MIKTQIEIINKLGLHARAASKLVSTASAFGCDIKIGRDDNMVDSKSIMGVMMLAACKGSVLNLHLEGQDQEAACQAIEDLVKDRFGEPE